MNHLTESKSNKATVFGVFYFKLFLKESSPNLLWEENADSTYIGDFNFYKKIIKYQRWRARVKLEKKFTRVVSKS